MGVTQICPNRRRLQGSILIDILVPDIGDTVTDCDEIDGISVDFISTQQILSRQQASMIICSAFTGSIKLEKCGFLILRHAVEIGPTLSLSLLIEVDCGYFDVGVFLHGKFVNQILRGLTHVHAGGFIEHEQNCNIVQPLFSANCQCYVSPVVLIQRFCCFVYVNFPLTGFLLTIVFQHTMGSFKCEQPGIGQTSGSHFIYMQSTRIVGLPSAVCTVIVPAVNEIFAILTAIQVPIGSDIAKRNCCCRVIENVIASSGCVVVVDYRVAGKGQIGGITAVVHAAAVAGGALVVVVARNGQVDAFLKDNLAVIGQAAAIVVSNGNHSALFNFAVSNTAGQLQAGKIPAIRISGHRQCGSGIHGKSTACINAVVSVVIRCEVRVLNFHLPSGKSVSGIILISNDGIDSGKGSAVRSISSTIPYRKGRTLHINARAIHIPAVGTINQERAAAGYVDLSRSSLVQLNALPFFPVSGISIDFKGRAIAYIDGRASIHVNCISASSRTAVYGEPYLCTVRHIKCAGQGQHQPRSSSYLGVPFDLDTRSIEC